ncbi:dihydroorotate dehydrogenase electron transfer subunit [Saccharicrinis carchari]|uniref:Dihydroorotate dehydrogenase B (NAD(+)), electron transfer subunit n=2 Tax=Saccharicrinis carchari TaxID=1168039 RepID=A0A521AVG4_SACCC|nr:dihydroorotate dehydrogenase electron transfer subunit [Saccharicrinis carchari]
MYMKKRVELFTVTRNRRINNEYIVLYAKANGELPDISPGEFVEIKVENGQNTFLRRPISIHEVHQETNEMLLLIQEVGEGSRLLAALMPGDKLDLIYPLGNSFTVPKSGRMLLVGGGVGVAPLLILGRRLREEGAEVNFLLGARDREILMDLTDYKQHGLVGVTTEDGSAGVKGYVTDHPLLKERLKDMDRVYTCGPDAMMRAVAAVAKEAGIPCEVSLENMMACGFGACLCCVVETREGNKNTCTEGPVFNIDDLKGW